MIRARSRRNERWQRLKPLTMKRLCQYNHLTCCAMKKLAVGGGVWSECEGDPQKRLPNRKRRFVRFNRA